MNLSLRSPLLSISAALILAGCSGVPVATSKFDDSQYWQRTSASDSIYLQGPKAQQMLHRDISRCVVELRELERLGSIRNAIPTDFQGRVLDPDQKAIEDWDTPERDGHLFAEHSDYHDFESCMKHAGWERIKYVPYDVADRARDTYIRAHIDYKYQTRFENNPPYNPVKKDPIAQNAGPYQDLND